MSDQTFSIALIGGICAGKSIFARHFSDLGVHVISADQFAKQLWSDELIKELIQDLFFCSAEAFSLSYVRQVVLQDEAKRKTLEKLLHPIILQRIASSIHSTKTPYCIVEMPLFVEINCPIKFDRVLLIDVPERLQMQRLMARDLSKEEAKQFLSIQAMREHRYKVAHEVIWNTIAKQHICEVVSRLDRHYQLLSAN